MVLERAVMAVGLVAGPTHERLRGPGAPGLANVGVVAALAVAPELVGPSVAGEAQLRSTLPDVHQRVIVIDVSDTHDQLQVLINPEITSSSGVSDSEEGCLSVPEVFAKVRRADYVLVKALNIHGDQYVLEANGLLAVCIQHEMDHLIGKVFVEYLSQLKQTRILGKIKKQQRNIM